MATAGHEVTAIDPEAPEGPLFRNVTLEEFDPPGRFDAVVASRALHHVPDLAAALDKIASLGPLLVLEEFGWDLLDEPTLDWWIGQRRVLAAAGHEPEGPNSLEDWRDEHADLHGYAALREAVDRNYSERFFAWMPYVYRYLGGAASEPLERTLIDAGAIKALGFRYAGVSSTVRSAAEPP